MNPEFQRNLWLELSPARLLLTTIFLLFVIAIFSAAPAGFPSSATVAAALYYFLVVLWGTRNAALSVIAEIRERTWDFQKLSAIPPFSLMWGKLFGATSFIWFGGLLCLPFVLCPLWQSQGLPAAARELMILIVQGVLAQGVSLLSSLNLIRRQHDYWRLDAFLCQVMGIVAAFSAYGVPALFSFVSQEQAPFSWWGVTMAPHRFQFFSTLTFAAWTLIGCTRAMRWELRLASGPFVWLAFLIFLGAYEAGFESWFALDMGEGGALEVHAVTLRLIIAGLAFACSAYGMVFLEPKDPVHLRWLMGKARSGRIGQVLLALDCWMLSFGATVLCTLVVALMLWRDPQPLGGVPAPALVLPLLAALGFFTRDMALFVLTRTWSRERGDFAALAGLAVLYVVLPQIAGPARSLWLPQLTAPTIALVAAWIEAAGVWAWTIARIERRAG